MSKELSTHIEPDHALYEIRLRGHLNSQWTDWFDGLAITLEANGTTLLRGPIVDQAALYGVLKRIRDIGIPLLSIICVEHGEEDSHTPEAQSLEEQNSEDRS